MEWRMTCLLSAFEIETSSPNGRTTDITENIESLKNGTAPLQGKDVSNNRNSGSISASSSDNETEPNGKQVDTAPLNNTYTISNIKESSLPSDSTTNITGNPEGLKNNPLQSKDNL